MPRSSAETINRWLDDFRARGHRIPGSVRLIERDLENDSDAGLVLIRFELASTDAFLERPSQHKAEWHVHFAPREEELAMGPVEVQNFADELHMVSRVAAYLDARTAEAIAARLTHRPGSAPVRAPRRQERVNVTWMTPLSATSERTSNDDSSPRRSSQSRIPWPSRIGVMPTWMLSTSPAAR